MKTKDCFYPTTSPYNKIRVVVYMIAKFSDTSIIWNLIDYHTIALRKPFFKAVDYFDLDISKYSWTIYHTKYRVLHSDSVAFKKFCELSA